MVVLTVTSCKFGLVSYFRLVQSKIVLQPEIMSPTEIITSHLSSPCVLYNKQMVTSLEVSSRERWHPGALVSMDEMQESGCFPHSS